MNRSASLRNQKRPAALYNKGQRLQAHCDNVSVPPCIPDTLATVDKIRSHQVEDTSGVGQEDWEIVLRRYGRKLVVGTGPSSLSSCWRTYTVSAWSKTSTDSFSISGYSALPSIALMRTVFRALRIFALGSQRTGGRENQGHHERPWALLQGNFFHGPVGHATGTYIRVGRSHARY